MYGSAEVVEERKKRENKELFYCNFKGCYEERIFAEELAKNYILAYSVESNTEFIIKNGIKVQNKEIPAIINKAKFFYSYNKLERFISKVLNKSVLEIPLYNNDAISAETCLNDKDCFWITAAGIYAGDLIRIRKSDFAIEWIYSPLEKQIKNRRYSKIIKLGDELFLIPDFAYEMDIYNISSNKWKRVSVKNENGKRLFSDAFFRNGWLYLFPSLSENIYKYNIEKEELSICCYKKKELENCKKNQNCGFHLKGTYYNGFYYFYSRLYNAILKFDFNNDALVIEKLFEKKPAMTCEFINNKIILIFKNDYCYYEDYNLDTKEARKYNLPDLTSDHAFHCCSFFNNFIYLLPGLYTHSYKIDMLQHKLIKEDKFDSDVWNKSKEEWKYVFSFVDNDQLISFDGISKKLLVLDKNDHINRFKLSINEEEWYRTILRKNISIIESPSNSDNEELWHIDYE